MITDQFSGNVYLAVGSTDMRKAINGLSILVEQAMDLNPFSGDLFVFCNRQRTIIKILCWAMAFACGTSGLKNIASNGQRLPMMLLPSASSS